MGNLSTSAQTTRRSDSIFRDKGNGTKVNYYIFPEFEIHDNVIEPGTEQEWHHHIKIEETVVVTSGELVGRWLEGSEAHEETLQVGDMFRVGPTVHTLANRSQQPATFLVFRFVPDGNDKRELIKNDRYADEVKV